jgi:hypothetical protein
MKVTVSRASSRFDEYEAELEIPEILIKQLLNLGREIPVEENCGSWDAKGNGDSTSFIIDINPDTGEVELMIYDFYVE